MHSPLSAALIENATGVRCRYERFYKAHRSARFFEHDYKANLAFGDQLISSVTLVAAAQLCLSGSMPVGAFVGLVSTMKRTTTSLPKASLRGL